FDVAHQRQPDLQLLLVGDGSLRASTQDDVRRRKLDDHVTFVGAKSPVELPDWYRAADLFVLSSWSEGLPNVLREAVACGRPFVSTDVGSVREIADSHGNAPFAELVPVGDATAMAMAIERVLRPEYLAIAQSLSCRSWRDTARDLVALLRTLRGEDCGSAESGGHGENVSHEVTV
ncbi:MAG: group 1 glycosyl transferase, partial [Planctomycetota bacterium]